MTRDLLDRWLEAVLAAPGLTALRDDESARRFLVEDAMRALVLLRDVRGRAVDVGSGGGSPGIPLAVALPQLQVTLLEAERRKCEFLERFATELPNVEVVWGRAEQQPTDAFDVAFAKALAKPPVAVELTLPLVRPGGLALLWIGESADREAVAEAASQLAGAIEPSPSGIAVIRKTGRTPSRFPRKPGIAKKRPLA